MKNNYVILGKEVEGFVRNLKIFQDFENFVSVPFCCKERRVK